MGPMWTARKILGSLINGGLSGTAPADERAAPDEIFARSLPAHGRDERRIPRHDNGVMIGLGCRHETRIESVRPTGGDNAGSSARGFLSAHWYARLWVTHQEHKKSAGFIRRRRISAEIFVREIALSHIDPLGQDTLPSPMAGCRIRISESLLMLGMQP